MAALSSLLLGWEGSPIALAVGIVLGVFGGWIAGRWYSSTFPSGRALSRRPAPEPLSQLAVASSATALLPVLRTDSTQLRALSASPSAPRRPAHAELERRLARLERRAQRRLGAGLWRSPAHSYAALARGVERALGDLDALATGGGP